MDSTRQVKSLFIELFSMQSRNFHFVLVILVNVNRLQTCLRTYLLIVLNGSQVVF